MSVSFILILIFSVHNVNSVPSGQGQQLFFDNFSSSQLSNQWNLAHDLYIPCINANACDNGNLTQSGGYLSLTNPRSQMWNGASCAYSNCASFVDVIANNTSPIISTSTTSQFVYMVWRLIPFNLTQIGNNPGSVSSTRNAETVFGLFGGNGARGISDQGIGIGWQLFESDSQNSGVGRLNSNSERESIGIIVIQPEGNKVANNCFADGPGKIYMPYNDWYFLNGCTGTNSTSIQYNNPQSAIDLNTVHTFTMEGLFQTSGDFSSVNPGGSWAAFKVDNNGWVNVTNADCHCINQAPGGAFFGNLYPYINSGYCMGTGSTPDPQVVNCSHQVPNQSSATLINYVLIDNYVPSSIPQGSTPPLNPANNPINTPTTNNPLTNPFGGINPSAIWQFLANSIGNGVPVNTGNFFMSPFYFGGSVLYIISILVVLLSLIWDPLSKARSPFILSLVLFIVTIANFLMGTLAWWIFMSASVCFLGIMVGTVPSTIGGKGSST